MVIKNKEELQGFDYLAQRLNMMNVEFIKEYVLVIFAGDNGVSVENVSNYKPMQSDKIVLDHLNNISPIAKLLNRLSIEEYIIDVGLFNPVNFTSDYFITANIRRGTSNFLYKDALSKSEIIAAIDIGRRIWDIIDLKEYDIIGIGEIGIGNTLCAAAILSVLSDMAPYCVTGIGSLDYKVISKKTDIINRSLVKRYPDKNNLLDILSRFGGLEIAALTGFILQGAYYKKPIMLDGFVTGVAAWLATLIYSETSNYLIASCRAQEIGHELVLKHMHLQPVSNLKLNYGEGLLAIIGLFISEIVSLFYMN